MVMADNGSGRLDRIESWVERIQQAHEEFVHEHKQLLRAQVVLQDNIEKLSAKVDRLVEHDAVQDRLIGENRERLDRFAAERKERDEALDERADKLVSAIGEWIRETRSRRRKVSSRARK